MRHGGCTTLTRQSTLEEPLAEASDSHRLGGFLPVRRRLVSRPLRLLGLGVTSLREGAATQRVLLGVPGDEPRRRRQSLGRRSVIRPR